MNRTVVITGASSGIGRALAVEFARRGYHLGLTARRLGALEELRAELQQLGDSERKIAIAALDVDQTDHVGPILHSLFAELGQVDTVVVNAGVNAFTAVGKGNLLQEQQVLQTNLLGAIATVNAAAEHFISAGAGGRIVGISSLAALQAMPKQAAYCASKAGFSMYLDAARVELKRHNIAITKILPGFVITEIMPKIDKYPFAVTAEQAARKMVDVIEKGKALGVVPAFPWKWLRPLFGHMPDALWKKLV
jgi:short-subunit dehydrogenase